MITCSLWRASVVSPYLEDNEMLVSNVIELACDDPTGINFSKITVALSHSATDLKRYEILMKGYEFVMKELIYSSDMSWKDLETKTGKK